MKVPLENGMKLDFICARNIVIPVNKENCLKSGIVREQFADLIPEEIVITMSKDKNYITKPELFLLDLLSNYQWDRPIHVLNQGGDLNIGIKDYLMYDGYSCHLVPFKNKVSSTDPGRADALELYRMMKEDYTWDAMSAKGWFVDYQNMYTFLGVMSQRQLFLSVANSLIDAGESEKALEMMQMCETCFPEENFPLESIPIGFSANDYMVAQMIENYYYLGAKESAKSLAERFGELLLDTATFYLDWGSLGTSEFETAGRVLLYVVDVCKEYGDEELSKNLEERFTVLLHTAMGTGEEIDAQS